MKSTITRVILLAGLILALTPTHAEIGVYGDEEPYTTLVSGAIVDDSDPISMWEPMGPSTPGSLAGSGLRPRVAVEASNSRPKAVWPTEGAINYDIAFSEWTGSAWSPIEHLTMSPANDTDPHLFIEHDGTVHVVWSRWATSHEVVLVTRPAGSSSWTAPVVVSHASESAKRPSVVVLDGELWVSYERGSTQPGMVLDVIAAKRESNGSFTRTVIASTTRPSALDAELHIGGSRMWIDWKHADNLFGCSELLDDQWTPAETEPWADTSWIGVESMRKSLRRHVLNP